MGRIGSGVRVNTRFKKFLPGAVLRSKKEGYGFGFDFQPSTCVIVAALEPKFSNRFY